MSAARYLFSVVLFGAALLPAVQGAQPGVAEFYAAPDGRAGADGSSQHPWDLQTALNQPSAVQPGATIWLRGGTYVGSFVSRVRGLPRAYVTVRAVPGERAILDNPTFDAVPPKSPLTVEGAYVTIRGLEVTSSNPHRVKIGQRTTADFRPIGINVVVPHTRLINNIVHDTGNCIGHWVQATDAEVYGNILYFCGFESVNRGSGHGLYVQNANGSKIVSDNVVFDQFGYGIHAYTEQGALDDLQFRRNVVFESGALSGVAPGHSSDILVGGKTIANRPVLDGNFTYRVRGSNDLGFRAGTDGAVLTGNYFIEGKAGIALGMVSAKHLSMTGNTFFGRVTSAYRHADNVYESEPHGTWRFVLPNTYDTNRATVVIYNWDEADVVSIDTASFLSPGDTYELRNVQDYFGDVVTGTFAGGTLPVAMRGHTVGVPVGWHAPATTFPTFGVFVLTKLPRATGAVRK